MLLIATSRLFAAEGNEAIPWRQDQPPNPPFSPLEALSKFTVPEGFKVELVASEPDIVNPIAMAFDDRGRRDSSRDNLKNKTQNKKPSRKRGLV